MLQCNERLFYDLTFLRFFVGWQCHIKLLLLLFVILFCKENHLPGPYFSWLIFHFISGKTVLFLDSLFFQHCCYHEWLLGKWQSLCYSKELWNEIMISLWEWSFLSLYAILKHIKVSMILWICWINGFLFSNGKMQLNILRQWEFNKVFTSSLLYFNQLKFIRWTFQ